MATLPSLLIEDIRLTLPVDSDQQPAVQERLENALTLFAGHVENQKPRGRYRYGYTLTPPNGEAIEIEAQPTRRHYNYLKLAYSPARIGPEGTAILVDYLAEILGPTYRELFYEGNLQKIVVGFDLRGTLLDDLLIERFRGRDKQIALIFDADLGLKSVSVGYDSTRRLIFKKLAECPSVAPCVRVAYLHDKGAYALSDFYAHIDNPLRSLTIRRYSEMPDMMYEISSRLLFDACRLRGRRQVLAMYPEDERERMKEMMMSRFPLIDESKLNLALWWQLRGEINALIPFSPIDSGEAVL